MHAESMDSDVSEASNWAEDAAMYSSESQLSDWEEEDNSSQDEPASLDLADADLADALQLADQAITGGLCTAQPVTLCKV